MAAADAANSCCAPSDLQPLVAKGGTAVLGRRPDKFDRGPGPALRCVRAAAPGLLGACAGPVVVFVGAASNAVGGRLAQRPGTRAKISAPKEHGSPVPWCVGQTHSCSSYVGACVGLVPTAVGLIAAGRLRRQKLHQRCPALRVTSVEPAVASDVVAAECAEGHFKKGVLPNGMRYCVLRHGVPPGRVEAHLEIHVGSIDEEENQQGMAHMLEHICFLGSPKRANFPRDGGLMSNALTDFQQTVYHANVDVSYVASGLDTLAEVGFYPAFNDERVEKERAAVLSEAQMVNDLNYRMTKQVMGAVHEENSIHARFPIGKESQIARWTLDELRSFHRRWYVPENSTIYVIGDLPEEQLIDHVERAFSAIPASAEATKADPWAMDVKSVFRPPMPYRPEILHDFVAPSVDGIAAQSLAMRQPKSSLTVNIATNDLVQGMQVCWAAKAPQRAARSIDGLGDWLHTRLVVEAARMRLKMRWRATAVPCGFHVYDSFREGVEMITITVMTEPVRWQRITQEVLQEMMGIIRYGFTAEELERAVRMFLRISDEAAISQPWAFMGTLFGDRVLATSRDIVDAVIASARNGHLLTNVATFNQALTLECAAVSLDELNAAARRLLGHLGGAASKPCGTAIVTCPSYLVDELSGQKVPFVAPSASEVEQVLSNIPEMSEDEISSRSISVPSRLLSAAEPVAPVERTTSSNGVVSLRLPNGIRARILVLSATSEGPSQGTLRLTLPGGRAGELPMGRRGALEAGLRAAAEAGTSEWSREQVQLYMQLNSVTSEVRPCADVLEVDAHFAPSVGSLRAALEWLRCLVSAPQLDLEGFAQAQLRMKGDANARAKSVDGQAFAVLKQEMYPRDPWLWDTSLEEVNCLTLGHARRALEAQLGAIGDIELDIVGSVATGSSPSAAGSNGGLSHAEEEEEQQQHQHLDAPFGRAESAVTGELQLSIEREVCCLLGTLPSADATTNFRQALAPTMAMQGCERRLHFDSAQERAMALIAGGAPGYWGQGDRAWEAETRARGFTWGCSHPLHPAKAMELMAVCMNNRLLSRVRDALSLTYGTDLLLTLYDGFNAGHFVCKLFANPEKLAAATAATIDTLRSPAQYPFTDLEVDYAKKALSLRLVREQRERGYWVNKLQPLPKGFGDAGVRPQEEQRIAAKLTADDVQRAWGALTNLADPFVVLGTCGPAHVQSMLPAGPFVERRRAAVEPAAAAANTGSGMEMEFLD